MPTAGLPKAQLRGGRRDLAYGVTQLFYGLLTAQQMQGAAQLQLGVAQASKGQTAARIAMLQAQQAKMQADGQVTQLQQQLNSLLCVPIDTHLELVEPPLPERIVIDVEQAVSQAIRCDPEVREAYEGVAKACAGMKIAKLSYIPAIDVVGGYLNQEVLNIVDEKDIGFIGVTGSVSIFEGGKRRATLNERRTQVAMAQHNLRMVKEKARLAARKVYRDYEGAWAALQMADEILQIRKEATKQGGPKASQELIGVEKAAQLEVMKAEINYRLAHAQLMSVIEGSGVPKTSNQ